MSAIAVSIHGLGKQYRIGGQSTGYRTFRETLIRSFKAPLRWLHGERESTDKFWALDDVSFDVQSGDAVGIIGRNGAGKSTLLKVLSRITKPTKGRVELYGRLASLLEVGTGFHPELTGRDNIFLNGAILGMTRLEINRKFDEIVDFSGVEKFLDTPVKHYSSGMFVRLAFAVAAHLEPEILVVDEVLAVGDAEFQKKCLGKMGEVAQEGRTVLFVSHNMGAIQSLCKTAVLLSGGKLVFTGNTDAVINKYLEDINAITQKDLKYRTDRNGTQQMQFTQIFFEDEEGNRVPELVSGRGGSIVINYEASGVLRTVVASIGIYSNFGQFLLLCNNEMSGQNFDNLPAKGQLKCKFSELPFSQGSYRLNLHCEVNGVMADWVQDAALLSVIDGDFYGTGKSVPIGHGGFLARHTWTAFSGTNNGY